MRISKARLNIINVWSNAASTFFVEAFRSGPHLSPAIVDAASQLAHSSLPGLYIHANKRPFAISLTKARVFAAIVADLASKGGIVTRIASTDEAITNVPVSTVRWKFIGNNYENRYSRWELSLLLPDDFLNPEFLANMTTRSLPITILPTSRTWSTVLSGTSVPSLTPPPNSQ